MTIILLIWIVAIFGLLIHSGFRLYKRTKVLKKVVYSEEVSDNMAQIINPDNPLDEIEL